MKPKGEFTCYLWESIQAIYNEIITHTFVELLADGTLPKPCFAHYLSQDILYIHDDSKAFEHLSKRATATTEQAFFKTLAKEGIAMEHELHTHFLKFFTIRKAKKKSPVIKAYTHFLIEHSLKSPYNVAAAALLPCFWVYNSVGKHLISFAEENNVYQKWIDTYQGGEYEEYTKSFIQIVERLAATASEEEKEHMREAFVQATLFELYFFEESMSKK